MLKLTPHRLILLIGMAISFLSLRAEAFTTSTCAPLKRSSHVLPRNAANDDDDKSSAAPDTALLLEEDDDEAPANIAGSEFFGGNRQKEELYDPIAEASADALLLGDQEVGEYSRFNDKSAFPDATARAVAESLQEQLNAVLYQKEQDSTTAEASSYTYANNLAWTSPFENNMTPLQQLQQALEFYRHVDVALVTARSLSDSVEMRWEISVAWPIFWAARVVLSGTSRLTLDKTKITKQVDTLDNSDLLGSIVQQLLPRFWDTYHIGMTPSAEVQPSRVQEGFFRNYKLVQIPPRLVYAPSVLDTGSREDANSQTVPNHAFATVIKTMGPKRQRYVPTSPVQVQLTKSAKDGNAALRWTIPVSVELQTNPWLPLPGEDPETPAELQPESNYEFQSQRLVATLPYGGCPQDLQVTEIRKQLYDAVLKDGLKPKLDDAGRPQFFFWQNDVKACYTEGGLGMVVYDWRPKFVKANQVGIELEPASDGLILSQA